MPRKALFYFPWYIWISGHDIKAAAARPAHFEAKNQGILTVYKSSKFPVSKSVFKRVALVTAKGYTEEINSKIKNDLRLNAALPTSITLDDKGITATVSTDTQKFARLDHRGLYIQNGALQITSTDGTTVVDGSGINASKIYTGSLNGIYMTIGSGNNVFKADSNGVYLGNANFASAPFRVTPTGNV